MNHLMTKSLIALLAFIFGVLAFTTLNGWQQKVFSTIPITHKTDSLSIELKPVEFFGWWKEKAGAPTNAQADETKLRNDYRKLRAWDANDSLSPTQIDIVCHLENKGTQPVDLMVLATGDFLVAPLKNRVLDDKGGLRQISLTERQNIGQQIIKQLNPGEVREIRFTNFEIKSVADKYRLKEYGELWPWELSVKINVVTTENIQVAEQPARLSLKPNLIW